MARRSDHTRVELEGLLVAEGWRQLAEAGLARFSASDVAKRVGYSVGTLYNVFGSYDGLVLAINARTLSLWAAQLRERLAGAGPATPGNDRLAALVDGYFEFAHANPKTWIAIYEHHMADSGPAPAWYADSVAEIMSIVAAEIALALPRAAPAAVMALARSLIATVHGHCVFSIYRTFNMLGEVAPEQAALARVREAIAAAKG